MEDEIPRTEQEYMNDLLDIGGAAAVGLYHLYRAEGQSPMEAYASVLKDIINIGDGK